MMINKLHKYKLNNYAEWEGMKHIGYTDTYFVSYPKDLGVVTEYRRNSTKKRRTFHHRHKQIRPQKPGILIALL